MTEPYIGISVTMDVNLEVDEIWPDGDAPELITAEAVAAVIKESGTFSRFILDWALPQPDVFVDVSHTIDNPHWGQDSALIPEHAPPRRIGGHSYKQVTWDKYRLDTQR